MTEKFSFSDCYEPAVACLESTILLSNDCRGAYAKDARETVKFICSAFGRESVAAALEDVILRSLKDIVTPMDCRLFLSQGMSIEGEGEDVQLAAQNKCRIMLEFDELARGSDSALRCLDYSFVRRYDAGVRFAELSAASVTGNVTVVRQTGIMQALGIGCEKSVPNAVRRLRQCAIWGDICSMRLLSRLHAEEGDGAAARTAGELAGLCSKFLKEGVTVLPEEVRGKTCAEAAELYGCISSVFYDMMIRGRGDRRNIDLSFAEALLHTKGYEKRLEYIKNYGKGAWKDETHPSDAPRNTIGFRG